MQQVIQKGNGINVTLQDKVGYVIRVQGYQGATFTVTFNGDISIGLSSHMGFPPNVWALIQNEILEGQKFMSKYVMMRRVTFAVDKNAKNDVIKPKDYVRPALYKDNKGRGILYFGKGRIFEGGFGEHTREKSSIVHVTVPDISDIQDCTMVAGTNEIVFKINGYRSPDLRVSKPTGLVELVRQFPLLNEYVLNVVNLGTSLGSGSCKYRIVLL